MTVRDMITQLESDPLLSLQVTAVALLIALKFVWFEQVAAIALVIAVATVATGQSPALIAAYAVPIFCIVYAFVSAAMPLVEWLAQHLVRRPVQRVHVE